MTEEFDPMKLYVNSEAKRRQTAKNKLLKRTERRIGRWGRRNLYFVGLTFSDPMIAAMFWLILSAMVSALLLSNADFVNPAVGMPVTISIFGLGIAGHNIGARSRQRMPQRIR